MIVFDLHKLTATRAKCQQHPPIWKRSRMNIQEVWWQNRRQSVEYWKHHDCSSADMAWEVQSVLAQSASTKWHICLLLHSAQRQWEDLHGIPRRWNTLYVLFSTVTYIRSSSEMTMNYAFDSVQLLVSLQPKNSGFHLVIVSYWLNILLTCTDESFIGSRSTLQNVFLPSDKKKLCAADW